MRAERGLRSTRVPTVRIAQFAAGSGQSGPHCGPTTCALPGRTPAATQRRPRAKARRARASSLLSRGVLAATRAPASPRPARTVAPRPLAGTLPRAETPNWPTLAPLDALAAGGACLGAPCSFAPLPRCGARTGRCLDCESRDRRAAVWRRAARWRAGGARVRDADLTRARCGCSQGEGAHGAVARRRKRGVGAWLGRDGGGRARRPLFVACARAGEGAAQARPRAWAGDLHSEPSRRLSDRVHPTGFATACHAPAGHGRDMRAIQECSATPAFRPRRVTAVRRALTPVRSRASRARAAARPRAARARGEAERSTRRARARAERSHEARGIRSGAELSRCARRRWAVLRAGGSDGVGRQ